MSQTCFPLEEAHSSSKEIKNRGKQPEVATSFQPEPRQTAHRFYSVSFFFESESTHPLITLGKSVSGGDLCESSEWNSNGISCTPSPPSWLRVFATFIYLTFKFPLWRATRREGNLRPFGDFPPPLCRHRQCRSRSCQVIEPATSGHHRSFSVYKHLKVRRRRGDRWNVTKTTVNCWVIPHEQFFI